MIVQRNAKKERNLNLDVLRSANVARLPEFKNKKGEPAHSKPDGSDWKLSAWSNAVLGELGEAANIIKKIEREDLSLEEAREALGDELADTQTYLDILAFRAGINLSEATIKKWNRISERVGSNIRIESDHWYRLAEKTKRAEITKEQMHRAVKILRDEIPEESWIEIRAAIKEKPDDWWVGHHFYWGMSVRNLLRQKGFKDNESPTGNLDDIYISIVGVAANET